MNPTLENLALSILAFGYTGLSLGYRSWVHSSIRRGGFRITGTGFGGLGSEFEVLGTSGVVGLSIKPRHSDSLNPRPTTHTIPHKMNKPNLAQFRMLHHLINRMR